LNSAYRPGNAAELRGIFQQIGSQLSNLWIEQ
jgi:hypothetical protein